MLHEAMDTGYGLESFQFTNLWLFIHRLADAPGLYLGLLKEMSDLFTFGLRSYTIGVSKLILEFEVGDHVVSKSR